MLLKRIHYFFLLTVALYVLALLVMTHRVIFRGITSRSKVDYLFNFNVRLSKDGIKETILEDQSSNTKLKLSANRKQKDGVVKSQEIIFIDRKEYADGSVELDQTNIQHRLKAHREIFINSLQKSIDGFEKPTKNMDKKSPSTKTRKYLFAFRYYEQLTMATKNVISFASLATATGREFVEPFVNSSRFSGLRTGVSVSRFMKEKEKFTVLDNYFDRDNLKYQLRSRGYSNMVPYKEFVDECREINVVVHFLYNESNTDRDLKKWYKIDSETIRQLRKSVAKQGWIDCNFVSKSNIGRFLGKKVNRYVCVDPEKVRTIHQFKNEVLNNSKCAAVVFWKGNGTRRTHFPLPNQITAPLRPVHIKHTKYLIDIAYDYIRNAIKRPFISVHVRLERHIKWRGIGVAKDCIQLLSKAISQHKKLNNLHKVFLAHDMGVTGSDTLKKFINQETLHTIERNLTMELDKPFRFDPLMYDLYDRGSVAIVEMHILSLGESLFTLGKGNFQEWVRDLFLSQNAMDTSLVHAQCDILMDVGSK